MRNTSGRSGGATLKRALDWGGKPKKIATRRALPGLAASLAMMAVFTLAQCNARRESIRSAPMGGQQPSENAQRLSGVPEPGGVETQVTKAGGDPPLAIELQAEKEYLSGFPVVIAITLFNPPGGAHYYRLKGMEIYSGAWCPVSLEWRPQAGGEPRRANWPPHPYFFERRGDVSLAPGERRRMILDASAFLKLESGQYELRAGFWTSFADPEGLRCVSEPIRIKIKAPGPTDQAWAEDVLRQIKVQRRVPESHWPEFLGLRGFDARTLDGLSREARRTLAPYLFLHQAFHGPAEVADLKAEDLEPLATGVLAPEALAFRYEILVARKEQTEAEELRQQIQKQWPGLKWRIEKVEKGQGLLTWGRSQYGPKSE